MDKKLQKSLLSFFEIMLQFCSVDPGSEKELDSGLWLQLLWICLEEEKIINKKMCNPQMKLFEIVSTLFL